MQATLNQIEREAASRLPSLLRELLDDPGVKVPPDKSHAYRGVDFVARDSRHRHWAFEVMKTSGPGQIDQAAKLLRAVVGKEDDIPVLVVPFMSGKGAETAERLELNWVDLSGNARIRAGDLYIRVQGLRDVS